MRVGLVSKWFNRGQPMVGRQIRSAVDQLGHTSFVLAKPRREKGPMGGALELTGIWDQPGVTAASAFETPLAEYIEWVEANRIEAVLCDQNYQFAELAELRRRGVRTIGRFVWEHFTGEHVEPAREAYDVVYSVTEAERERYRGFGLATPRVPWGLHPELLAAGAARASGEWQVASGGASVTFVLPGGFLGHRKPAEPVIEAFSAARGDHLRLLVKAQVERSRLERIAPLVEADPRIELLLEDQPWDEHLRTIAACDVSVSPSRWEGLGLPLYEAVALGLPTITNDDPPMNEVIADGDNGLLVPSHPDGEARSGIPARRPDIDALAAAIDRLADRAVLEELRASTIASRERVRWERTVAALGELLDS